MNKLYTFLTGYVTLALITLVLSFNASAALSGTCGMIATPPIAPGASSSTYNVLALINFSTNTITYSSMDLSFSSGVATPTQSYGTKAITVTSNSNITGSYTMSFTSGSGNHTLIFNILPVNSGNTILIQGTSDPFSGVCQMQ
ncbi:MAG: hypothetical protein B7Z60_07065 [Ferrovum sp. 37-45-19]|jgi:hypothetical protein|uniref:hypothetical protein n=1 Tax=Ferrovum sp. JA12 TaxID=1356299 RepID=UPI000702D425|nr:hypothetical protein [Ferrovum sp. JA12]OYV93843.1 MAG: hypothetical protein B7Z60_07065 [Ferrovum sp. 37-45-19]OZB32143.1 MAG: hypothetical protein B7X47_07220 [Ferrovum sp. 34-44-207]HQT82007.1 hypothetical protein [Ferrovaceae bacterium]KRH78648.1 hypothetical protein FERRO_16400 [Ferrovum sp. JA12]HQU07131.1 hypothetical protein [Ferrovaceae bacterium]